MNIQYISQSIRYPLHKSYNFLLATLLFFTLLPLVNAGESIHFDGSNPGMLQTAPMWIAIGANNSLFPGTQGNPGFSGNTVSMSGGVVDYIFGGGVPDLTSTLTVQNNMVSVSGGVVQGNIFGGVSSSRNAVGNTVQVMDGDVGGSLFGGRSDSGSVIGNAVSVTGGKIDTMVSGGYSDSGVVSRNIVSIAGGIIGINVYGGFGFHGAATENVTSVTAGEVKGDVYGGLSFSDGVTGNSVDILGGKVDGNVYGGFSYSDKATSNQVNIMGGELGKDVYGGVSLGDDVIGNTINITGGSVAWSIFGGSGSSGVVSGNVVNIAGGVVRTDVYGGHSASGHVIGNTVAITGGTVAGHIAGGGSTSGNAVSNSVSIMGGKIDGNVYGGLSSNGSATGNVVSISSGAQFSSATHIYGGWSSSGEAFAHNRLEVLGPVSTKLANVANFESYRFVLPSTLGSQSPMLWAEEIHLEEAGGGNRVATVSQLSFAQGGGMPRTGHRYVLMQADHDRLTGDYQTHTLQLEKGLFMRYGMQVEKAGDQLIASVISESLDPRAKSLVEGRAAGMGFVAQGADMVTGKGILALQEALDKARTVTAFGFVQGGSIRHETGSHVDVDGVTLMLGVGGHVLADHPNLSTAAFIEAGWGNYDSYNSFNGVSAVSGKGDTRYYGAGMMGRVDMADDFYLDAMLRIGQMKTDFRSHDLLNPVSGQRVDYESRSTYYGASLGVGQLQKIDETKTLDLYARYLWTHLSDDEVRVANDPLHFDSANSHRFRLGGRLNYRSQPHHVFYAGAAWEYEFDGDAQSSLYGNSIDAPSLEGSTGIFELGLSIQPESHDRLLVDVGMQGYAGQREGVTGSVRVNYNF